MLPEDHNVLWTEIQIFCDRAEELYNNILNDNNYENLPSPLHWVYNQDYYRSMWLNLRSFIQNQTFNYIFNQNVIEYMEFMYETFPAGLGMCLRRMNSSTRERIDIIIN